MNSSGRDANDVIVRPYRLGEEQQLWQLLHNTVHRINIKDYSLSQVNAWAPENIDLNVWKERLVRTNPTVAISGNEIVGFVELETNGHIDCFYIAWDEQGKGLGSLLIADIHTQAHRLGITRLYAEASISALGFFQRNGFVVENKQQVHRQGQSLTNYRVSKELSSS